ncbi:MAG: hypothetical protein HOI66_05080 [Verrucomicrobia bacterium]|jgi:hypothetical protein|nr:hypothetical protein [Verrucomicrobiota bacterium]MDA7644874.1 hypothetical protein [bacterium]
MKWTPADKRRRWFGLFYLLMAIGMLVWGQTILKPHLTGFTFIFYWLACFAMTLLAMITAMLDIWVIRLRQRHSENEAAKKVLGRSAKKKPHQRSEQDSKS